MQFISFFFFIFFLDLTLGESLFLKNCAVCHPSGKNLILPEKSLKKENLEANGMTSINSLTYLIRNGKNGMPAFGNRLDEKNIKKISYYILLKSETNFDNE